MDYLFSKKKKFILEKKKKEIYLFIGIYRRWCRDRWLIHVVSCLTLFWNVEIHGTYSHAWLVRSIPLKSSSINKQFLLLLPPLSITPQLAPSTQFTFLSPSKRFPITTQPFRCRWVLSLSQFAFVNVFLVRLRFLIHTSKFYYFYISIYQFIFKLNYRACFQFLLRFLFSIENYLKLLRFFLVLVLFLSCLIEQFFFFRFL